jgi:hypothetical protein
MIGIWLSELMCDPTHNSLEFRQNTVFGTFRKAPNLCPINFNLPPQSDSYQLACANRRGLIGLRIN